MTNNFGFERSVNITVHAKTPEVIDDAIEETRQVLRRVRNVRRGEEDNFEFFNSESSIAQFNQMTAGVKVGAFVIGIVALIVAGVGIMNIMLISVTERTKEIGIRKCRAAAMGRHRAAILHGHRGDLWHASRTEGVAAESSRCVELQLKPPRCSRDRDSFKIDEIRLEHPDCVPRYMEQYFFG